MLALTVPTPRPPRSLDLSSRTSDALALLLALARAGEVALTPGQLLGMTGLRPSRLEALLPPLRAGQLVVGQRGRRGGYRLARPASQITLHDVGVAIAEIAATPGPTRGLAAASARLLSDVTASGWRSLSLEQLLGIMAS